MGGRYSNSVNTSSKISNNLCNSSFSETGFAPGLDDSKPISTILFAFQTRFENCNDHFLQPQSMVKVLLNDLNIKFFDYTKIFCNHNKPSLLFLKYDPVHLSFKGHKLVFNLLKKDLNYLRNL